MNANELFDATTILSAVPLGSKEQRVFAAIAKESAPTTFGTLLETIGGEAHSLRQLLSRLKEKSMIDATRDSQDARTYKLSTKGKNTLKKITK